MIKKTVQYFEELLNNIFTPKYNPSYYLGAIGMLFFFFLIISGIYLFIFYKIASPYKSVQYITEGQKYYGGFVRSIHRYSADGLIVVVLLHLIKEFINNRYRYWRKMAWISGIIILVILYVEGIIGYWMVWDDKAKTVALLIAGILDYIPVFIEPPPMGFLSNEGVSRTLFFILTFLHLAIPILSMILLLVHISKVSRPVIKPPRPLTLGIIFTILGTSLVIPATSISMADVKRLPVGIPIDWLYLNSLVIFSSIPPWVFFPLFISLPVLLFILPWIGRGKRNPVAVVDLAKCGGCGQCARDCPYEATYMRKRTDGRPYELEAVVIPERCAGCGICLGACNFEARGFPSITERQIKEEVAKAMLSVKNMGAKILGFVCEKSVKKEDLLGIPGVKVIALACGGMVQPSMVEQAFKSGADGVFLAGCQMGDCHYREGNKWIQARLQGERFPAFSMKIDRSRIRTYWNSVMNGERLKKEISLFQNELREKALAPSPGEEVKGRRKRDEISRFARTRPMLIPAFFALALPFVFISLLSQKPEYSFYPKDVAILKVAFKYHGKPAKECKKVSEEERQKDFWQGKQKHMQRIGGIDCGREKLPTSIELFIDGEKRVSKEYYPTGLKKDGSTFVFEELVITPGSHEIRINMKDVYPEDAKKTEEKESIYAFEQKINFNAGEAKVLGFSKEAENFYFL